MTEHNHLAVSVNGVSVSYNGVPAIEKLTLQVPSGQIVGIIGPNGAGKTTLIKAIMGLVKLDTGSVRIFEGTVAQHKHRIAYVPQQNRIDLNFPVSVLDTVMMGRYPYIKRLRRPSPQDQQAVSKALATVGMAEHRQKQIGELSGGERQRVFLARALSQQAELFFLDEPFSAIDFTSEDIMVHILKNLASRGKTIFVVHHDLNKASRYFDTIILLNRQLVGWGKASEVLTPRMLSKAYQGQVAQLEEGESPLVITG